MLLFPRCHVTPKPLYPVCLSLSSLSEPPCHLSENKTKQGRAGENKRENSEGALKKQRGWPIVQQRSWVRVLPVGVGTPPSPLATGGG